MSIWPPSKHELKRPTFRSLAQRLIDAVEAGELRAGAKLPTHRALAFELGLSVQTISRAYEELKRQGIISGEVGRGSFVRSAPADAHVPWHRPIDDDRIVDCSMLVPVTGEIHAERMSATLAGLADNLTPNVLVSFRPRATLEEHCERALGWLSDCGITPRVDQVLPTNGNTSAMTIALMTCAHPGDVVVTEEIGHHTLKSLTGALGLNLIGLTIDDEGIVPDAFERACEEAPVKALFLLPSGLNPTAAMMRAARRTEIAEIARRHGVWIVENDAWGPLQPDRPKPIAAIAPERTFYFTGLTKCVLPGLRIAWLVVPERMISAARTRHLATNWMATPLIAEIATRWLEDGTSRELLRWQQNHLARRNRLAADVLQDLPHCAIPNGMHVWLPLPDVWDEDAFVAHARHHGIAVAAGANFSTGRPRIAPAVRICLGAGTEADIAKGLSVVARLARSEPEVALLAI
jgi:DNA-binding transcriptional MocR family regulator